MREQFSRINLAGAILLIIAITASIAVFKNRNNRVDRDRLSSRQSTETVRARRGFDTLLTQCRKLDPKVTERELTNSLVVLLGHEDLRGQLDEHNSKALQDLLVGSQPRFEDLLQFGELKGLLLRWGQFSGKEPIPNRLTMIDEQNAIQRSKPVSQIRSNYLSVRRAVKRAFDTSIQQQRKEIDERRYPFLRLGLELIVEMQAFPPELPSWLPIGSRIESDYYRNITQEFLGDLVYNALPAKEFPATYNDVDDLDLRSGLDGSTLERVLEKIDKESNGVIFSASGPAAETGALKERDSSVDPVYEAVRKLFQSFLVNVDASVSQ